MNEAFVSTCLLLLILLDPLGNTPVFMSLLRHLPPRRRRWVIVRESLIALVVLVFFVFAGDRLLALLRLSDSALTISGGVILFLIALRMVFPAPAPEAQAAIEAKEPFVVPMAIPMMVGPAALATVVLTARASHDPWPLLAAVLVAMLCNTVLLLSGEVLARLLGRAGMEALERLMGLMLYACHADAHLGHQIGVFVGVNKKGLVGFITPLPASDALSVHSPDAR